jgi:hypothetical protein
MSVFDELKREIRRYEQTGGRIIALSVAAGLHRQTISRWMGGGVGMPHLASMIAVARELGKEIELTGDVAKMVGFYPPPKPRTALWRLQ